MMTKFIFNTCGAQHGESHHAPDHCEICEDDRQYVGWEGQKWTTHEELAEHHEQRIEIEEDLLAIGIKPAFAIDQRAFLLPTDVGNILWESVSLVAQEAIDAINKCGGLDRIIISHPHFYSSMGVWSDAFGGVEILIHEADKQWVQRPHPSINFWSGDDLALSDSVTLIRAGGTWVKLEYFDRNHYAENETQLDTNTQPTFVEVLKRTLPEQEVLATEAEQLYEV